MRKSMAAVCLSIALSWAVAGLAQLNPYKDGTPGVTGYRSEIMAEVMIQQDKLVRLAEAIPADKYNWRPAPDVRSIAEVFLHIAGSNYALYKRIGAQPPAGFNIQGYDKSTTDKTKIIGALKDSFEHGKKAIMTMSDADLEKSMDWFGGKNTERGILIFIVRHTAEHLGQSIAYARSVGVVPPWTEDAQRAQKKEAAKGK